MPADAVPRFLALTDVAEVLSISVSQVYALVRRGDLPAIKIGGRGQWRVETSELENYIAGAYATTRQFISEHPFVADDGADDDVSDGDPAPIDVGAGPTGRTRPDEVT